MHESIIGDISAGTYLVELGNSSALVGVDICSCAFPFPFRFRLVSWPSLLRNLINFSYDSNLHSIMESHSGSRSPLDLYETKHSDILAPDSDRSSETSNSTDTESECLANGSDENGESSFSSKSSSASSLQSLAKFIQSNLKPVGGEYNAYATSYITTAVPSHAFFPDDTDSYTAEAPPFLEAVKIKDFARREARRDELGHSSRREKIIPQSKSILKQIQASENNNAEGQTEFLFFKARQWCEVNKALFVDAKYPKVGPEVIRRKYSEEHKSASKDVKKLGGLSDARRVFKINDPMEAISSTDEEREQIGQQVPLDTGEDQRGDRLQDRLQEELANIFGTHIQSNT